MSCWSLNLELFLLLFAGRSRGGFWLIVLAKQPKFAGFQDDIGSDRGCRLAAKAVAYIFDHNGNGELRIFERSDTDKPTVSAVIRQIFLVIHELTVCVPFLFEYVHPVAGFRIIPGDTILFSGSGLSAGGYAGAGECTTDCSAGTACFLSNC